MNPADLESRLREDLEPAPGDAYWREVPSRVPRRIVQTTFLSTQDPIPPTHHRFRLTTIAAAAGVALLFISTLMALRHTRPAPPDIRAMMTCFEEVSALFPGRLRFIVEDRDGLRMDLAEANTLVSQPRVYLEICGPAGCSRFVTSSGQAIDITSLPHEVFIDGHGHIQVAGPMVLWSSADPDVPVAGFQIKARVLEPRS
jgi:hypothetical protein